jgi:hypothetical protein
MKTLNRTCIGVVAGAAIGVSLIGTAPAQDGNLIGTWNCAGGAEDAETGMSMNLEFEQTFTGNGTYERTAEVRIAAPVMQLDLTIVIDESGTWRRDGMDLAETPTAIEISSNKAMPSQIEAFMLQQMSAEVEQELNNETVTRITSLTATTMTVDQDELETTCTKA